MRQLTSFIIYIAIGALCHALFYTSVIDLHNAWTLVWLVLWPAMLFAYIWYYLVILFVIIFVAAAGIMVYDNYIRSP